MAESAYDRGRKAGRTGENIQNPFPPTSVGGVSWNNGWNRGRLEYRQQKIAEEEARFAQQQETEAFNAKVKAYLKEHLSIHVSQPSSYNEQRVRVELALEGEVISSDYCTLPTERES